MTTPVSETERNQAEAAGRLLAQRHQPVEPAPENSVLNFSEAPYEGDWSLRSALVRLAQPEPVRAGATLELVRRCEGALHPLLRALERHTVLCHWTLSPATMTGEADGWPPADEGPGYPDTRTVDLIRLAGHNQELLAAVVAGYSQANPLEPDELAALNLVEVALDLAGLAQQLSAWALEGPLDPPVDEVDSICRALSRRLDDLGVARETRPEGERRPGERRPGERRPGRAPG